MRVAATAAAAAAARRVVEGVRYDNDKEDGASDGKLRGRGRRGVGTRRGGRRDSVAASSAATLNPACTHTRVCWTT